MIKFYRFFIACHLAAAFLILSAQKAFTEENPLPYPEAASFLSAGTASELEKLKNAKLRLGVFSLYDYTDKDGEEIGNAADFKKLLEKVFGLSVSIVKLSGEEEGRKALENGSADMVFGLRKDSGKNGDIFFSGPVFTRRLYIFSSERQARNLRKNNIKGLHRRTAAYYKGLDVKNSLRRDLDIDISLIESDSLNDMIREVNEGNEVDFGIIPADLVFNPEIKAVRNRLVEAKDAEDSSGLIAVKDKKFLPVIEGVEEYYDKTGKRPFDILTARNTDALYSLAFTNLNGLTDKQREFLKNPEGLKVYVPNPSYPLIYLDSSGNFTGIYADMLNNFSKLSKMPLSYSLISEDQAKEKKKNLKENEILLGIFPDDSDKPFLSSFNGYYNTDLTIFGRDGSNIYWRDSDRVGTIKNSQAAKYLDQTGIRYKGYAKGNDLFDGLKNGEIDFAAAPAQSYYGQILKGNYWLTKIESTPVTLWPDMFLYRTGSMIAGLLDIAFNGFIDYHKIMDSWSYRTDETTAEIVSKYYVNVRNQAKKQLISTSIIAGLMLLAAFLYMTVRIRASKNRDLMTEAEAEKRANKAKSIFLSNMSHEIRTPLNVILGLSRIAIKNNDGKNALEALKKIEESGVHLLTVVNDVLDMSKIEAGKYELASEVFDLKRTLNVIEIMISVRAAEKRQDFKIETDADLPRYVVGDGKSVRQILINLLSNAVKFTPENGRVSMRASLEKDYGENMVITFTVEDNGIGMTKQQAAKVFSPFEQADANISRSFGGTGLGLSISKHLAELMGGGIAVETEYGRGSAFIFTAPFGKPDRPPEEIQETPEEAAGNRRPRVMIVDDVEINRMIIANMLESINPEITEASTGKNALELYGKSETGYYDLILMDVHMPEMNGYDAARAIRSSGRADAEKVIIIAITANAFKEDIEAAKNAGMNGHISKPIDMPVLLNTINRFVRKGDSK